MFNTAFDTPSSTPTPAAAAAWADGAGPDTRHAFELLLDAPGRMQSALRTKPHTGWLRLARLANNFLLTAPPAARPAVGYRFSPTAAWEPDFTSLRPGDRFRQHGFTFLTTDLDVLFRYFDNDFYHGGAERHLLQFLPTNGAWVDHLRGEEDEGADPLHEAVVPFGSTFLYLGPRTLTYPGRGERLTHRFRQLG